MNTLREYILAVADKNEISNMNNILLINAISLALEKMQKDLQPVDEVLKPGQVAYREGYEDGKREIPVVNEKQASKIMLDMNNYIGRWAVGKDYMYTPEQKSAEALCFILEAVKELK